MQIDPTRIRIEASDHHVWQEPEQSFQEMMAEQLHRAPWLGLAILFHAIAFLILLSLDFSQPQQEERAITMKLPPEKPELQKPEKPETKPEVEPVESEPVLTDSTDIVENPSTVESFTPNDMPSRDAFDTGIPNAVGLAGGGPNGGGGGKIGRGGPRGRTPLNTTKDHALAWLADHQDEDGKWDADGFMKHDDAARGAICDGAGNSVHDVGVTGLALLAFLGDNNTLRSGPYKENVKRAVNWLRTQQQENGLFGNNASHDFIYDHAIASYAMVEAYGLSNYRSLRKYAQRAISYLESHRNPYMVWRYQPRDNDNDTSVTGWGVMAYKSAKHFGLDVNDRALNLCETWLDRVTDPTTGRHGYTKRGELSSRHPGDHGTRFPPEKGEAMTAVGLFCRYFLGQNPKENAVMAQSANLLTNKMPSLADGAIDHYYWYYASYALYQAGGSDWKKWSRQLTPTVVKTQRSEGNHKGSWDPVGVWGEDGGRVYSTALMALTCEVYYRYSRLVR